jgi:hypothetical protein
VARVVSHYDLSAIWHEDRRPSLCTAMSCGELGSLRQPRKLKLGESKLAACCILVQTPGAKMEIPDQIASLIQESRNSDLPKEEWL